MSRVKLRLFCRCRNLQTSLVETVNAQIVDKEPSCEINKDTDAQVESAENKHWMTVANFARSPQATGDAESDPPSVDVSKKRSKKNNTPKETHACVDCGRLFKLKDSLIRHMRIHRDERPFTCHICGKQFRDSGGLCRHLKDVHARVKNFSCEMCGRSFASKATREDHQRTHTGERPYVCDSCGKSFKSKASLYTHSKIHTDDFPHPCLHCDKRFRRRQELLSHITTHTGERNFECNLCSRRFRVKTELKRHALSHSNEKPFTCDICGFRCKQARYLNNHVRHKHSLIVTSKTSQEQTATEESTATS